MGTRHRYRAFWAVLSASAAFGWAGVSRADLTQSSPFLAPNTPAGAHAGGPQEPVELRGVMPTSLGVFYLIYDTARKTSAWVGLNEAGHEFVVKAVDPGGESVTVSFQGRTMRLALRAAKVASAGSFGGTAQAGPAGNPAIAAPVVLNPTPADEQKRLDAVAAEVRRRRQEREKAALGTQNGTQPPSSAPPAIPNR
jgi:hypothetical protein